MIGFLALLISSAGGIATYFNYNKQLVKIGKKNSCVISRGTCLKSHEQFVCKFKGSLLSEEYESFWS